MRWEPAVGLVVLAGCGAHIADPGTTGVDAALTDGAVITDASLADASPDAPPPAPCIEGDARTTTPSGCFMIFSTPKLRVDARATCSAIGAHLAYVKSTDDEATIALLAGNVDTALGADDLTTEATFLWEDGTPLTIAPWGTGEPNNGNNVYQEDCVIYAGAKMLKGWDDRPCAPPPAASGSYAFICQR